MNRSFTSAILAITSLTLCARGEVRFNQDIRPILSKKCIACHGPDAEKRDGHLRLDKPDGEDGAYRKHDGTYAIKPGNLEQSEIWKRINSHDDKIVMPPPTSHFKPLSSEEKALFKQWILDGAEYEDFWAFVPARKATPPTVKQTAWSQQDIDLFALAKMEEKGQQPKQRADKRTLIRRATLDLTGLPPTLQDIDAFVSDQSPQAYQKLIDRLIARPQYGEHMAKYWLDLVRFADTNGMHHDHYRDHTPYRDWVIDSFNNNLPYDKFTKYQIAGDLYDNPSTEQLIASGFNRLHLIIDVGTALPEESHFKNVVDRVSAVGTAFMGLTMQCAACHDHKYDPITQKDFFSMFAFFNNFDGKPETGARGTTNFYRGLQQPFINLTTPAQDEVLKKHQDKIASLKSELKTLKSATVKNNDKIKAKTNEIKTEQKARDHFLRRNVRGAMVMKERKEARKTHLRVRGNYDQMGEVVPRNTPHFLPPLKTSSKTATRMDLANWLVAPQNPLTARVAVNRFWQQFFGTGLVKTSEDLGGQGEWPSHPRLLDHLTLSFIDSDWDIKALVKSIMLSETYQQSSIASPNEFKNDPDNRLLARGSRTRLDSEVVRDSILAMTGLLNLEQGGKSVKTPQPDGLWKMVALPTSYPNTFTPDKGPNSKRRSIYTFWKRGLAPPQMTIFDAPSRDACIARRERTNTPLQALLLMNETEYFAAAGHKARQLLAEDSSEDEKIQQIYETITAQPPSSETLALLKKGLSSFRQESQLDNQAAWTMLVHSLLNLDSTKNRE